MITLGIVVGFCLLLLVFAFVAPGLSHKPERGGQKAIGTGSRGASKAPGRLGRWLGKPFSMSSRAVSKSGRTGRRGRSKMPF